MESQISGVLVIPLKKIPDERGTIFHMMRCDDPHFDAFGEIYFSKSNPGVIKGWHRHSVMTMNYAVIQGMIKLVLYDDRTDSPTRGSLMELFIGDDNFSLVKIPPGIWNGHKALPPHPALVANCATHPHDPHNLVRLDPFSNKIPYDWAVKHK